MSDIVHAAKASVRQVTSLQYFLSRHFSSLFFVNLVTSVSDVFCLALAYFVHKRNKNVSQLLRNYTVMSLDVITSRWCHVISVSVIYFPSSVLKRLKLSLRIVNLIKSHILLIFKFWDRVDSLTIHWILMNTI